MHALCLGKGGDARGLTGLSAGPLLEISSKLSAYRSSRAGRASGTQNHCVGHAKPLSRTACTAAGGGRYGGGQGREAAAGGAAAVQGAVRKAGRADEVPLRAQACDRGHDRQERGGQTCYLLIILSFWLATCLTFHRSLNAAGLRTVLQAGSRHRHLRTRIRHPRTRISVRHGNFGWSVAHTCPHNPRTCTRRPDQLHAPVPGPTLLPHLPCASTPRCRLS